MIRQPKNNQRTSVGKKVCKSCLKEEGVKVKENGIVCNYCEHFYHIKCINLDINTFNKLVANKNLIWSCPDCVSNSVNSEVKNFDEFKNDIKELLQKSLEKMNDSISGLREDIIIFKNDTNQQLLELKMDVEEKINVINRDLDAIKINVTAGVDLEQVVPIIKESLHLDNIVESSNEHHQKIIVLTKELISVESEMDNMNRLNRLNNLILDGVPIYKNENNQFFYDVIEGIANYLEVDMSYYDINTVFRLQKNKENHIPSIMIGFHSKLTRDAIFNQYLKKRAMKLSDINKTGSSSRLYLNEHLTSKYSKLVRSAKDLKSSGAITKVYSRNGIPMVVPNGKSTAVKIFSFEDLDKIKANFEMKSTMVLDDNS